MYLWLTTFTKTLPQMSFHLYFFAIFISLWGSTHDSANCWSAHRSSAARDSFKRVHDLCKAWWRRPGAPPPPKQKSWLRRWLGQTIHIQETKWIHWKRSSIWVIVWCQRRSPEICTQQSKDCLVKVEGNYWGDVRQEHTNKVERQSVQDGYKTGHGVWSIMLGS